MGTFVLEIITPETVPFQFFTMFVDVVQLQVFGFCCYFVILPITMLGMLYRNHCRSTCCNQSWYSGPAASGIVVYKRDCFDIFTVMVKVRAHRIIIMKYNCLL